MCEQRPELVFFGQFQECLDVIWVNVLGFAAAGIAGEELEHIGADGDGVIAMGVKPWLRKGDNR